MPVVNEARKENLLQYWVNNPELSFDQITKDCHIAKKTFDSYRKNEDFMKRYRELCQQRFKELEAKAIEKLQKAVERGDWNAVKYVLDGQGYQAAQKIDMNTNTINVNILED